METVNNKRRKWARYAIVASVVGVVGAVSSVAAAEDPFVEILASTPVSGTVDIKYTNGTSVVSDVYWTGDIPTKVRVVSSSSYQTCFTLKFSVTPTLSYKEISDASTSLSLDFELWTTGGEKVAYDYLGSSQWNPLGGQTVVSWQECGDWQKVGTYNLIVKTSKTLSTTGLLSRYLSGTQNFTFTIDPQVAPSTTTSTTIPRSTTAVPTTAVPTTVSAVATVAPSTTAVVTTPQKKTYKVRCKRGKTKKTFVRTSRTCPKGWKKSS